MGTFKYKQLLIAAIIFIVSFNFIFLNLAQSGTGGDPPTGPTVGSTSGDDATPENSFDIKIDSSNKSVFRCDFLLINYSINTVGDLKGKNIIIIIPKEFSHVMEIHSNKKNMFDNREIKIVCDEPDPMPQINLSYKAKVSSDANNNSTIYLDPKNRSYIDFAPSALYEVKGVGCYINIRNNIPNVTSFEVNNLYGMSPFDINRNDSIELICRGQDKEDRNYTWLLYDNISIIDKKINGGSTEKFSYIASNPGIHRLKAILFDAEGEYDESNSIEFRVSKYSSPEVYRNLIVIIFIVCLMLIGTILRYLMKYWIFPLAIFVLWMIAIYYIPQLRLVQHFEISLYFVVLVISAYFIESNFPQEDSKQQFWKGKDRRLWFFSSIGMSFLAILLVCYFHDTGPKTSTIDYYRSGIQVFGFILAAVISFSVWYLGRKSNVSSDANNGKELRLRKEFKNKADNFFMLCISIIILSIVGLMFNVPILKFNEEVNSIPIALSLFSFESTLLLTIPTFVCLYAFYDWIMNIEL